MDHIQTINAQPAAVDFEPSKSALLVIDMQNDFGSAGGMFDRAGIPIDGILSVTAQIASAARAARKAGIQVIFIKMGFLEDLSNLGPAGAPNRVRHEALGVGREVTEGVKTWRVLVRDGWGTQVVDALAPQPDDISVWKHRYSAFFETELHDILTKGRIKHLFVTGCTTSICVDSTVRDAFFRDYHCVLLTDCMAEPIAQDAPRSNHEATLLAMQLLFAWTASSAQFIDALT